MADERFSQAVASVDVLDLCGRIIANPDRAMVSLAGKVALAMAVERMWEVCLEADVLVHALERTMPWAEPVDDEHAEHVAIQAGHLRALIAALRGETNTETNKQETKDGSCNG